MMSDTAVSATTSPPPPPPPSNEAPQSQDICCYPQLQVFNRLIQPVYVFDFIEERNRWANTAALEFWESPNMEEYRSRDRTQNRSTSTFRKLQQVQKKIEQGGHVQILWTLYPKGIAKTVHLTVTGIQLPSSKKNHRFDNRAEGDVDSNTHYCMLFHAVPVDPETVENQSLRGVEMLRHLPMAVCQFDMEGTALFQNQWALLPDDEEDEMTAAEVEGTKARETEETEQTVKGNDQSSGYTAVETAVPANSQEESGTQTDELNKPLPTTDGKAPSTASINNQSHSPDDNHHKSNSATTSTAIPTSSNSTATPPPSTNDSEKRATSPSASNAQTDFSRRFVDPKVAKEAFTAITTTTEQVIQLEAELRSTVLSKRKSEWAEVALRKVTDPVTGKAVILYSAQDKSDAQLAQQERAASIQKSEFLAIMAHEIRTPLHQVIGCIDLLRQSQPLTEEQLGYVNVLQTSAAGLMTVISDVLDYSKLESGEMKIEHIPYEPLSVVESTLSTVRTTCAEKQLTLTLDWSPVIPFRLLGDPNRVRQVLLNLISNAVKFTKKGGITVSGQLLKQADPLLQQQQHDTKTTVNSGKSPNDGWLKVTVADTGIGICETNQGLVFQKYQQATKSVARTHGGTGLGLSICQSLITYMDGYIGVNSQLGEGSKFWFLLPVKLATNANDEGVLQSAMIQSRGEARKLSILVAEDNRVNQKLIANMLKRLGHESTIAEHGKKAIDLVEESTFDLVLMDIQMPVMDGVEATRRLRAMGYSDLPILALTASVKQNDYRELGFTDWLTKPTPLKALREKILHSTRDDCDTTPVAA